MITCPSTGQPCYHEVCNAGGWPCDPAPMATLAKVAPLPDPPPEPEPILGTEEEPTTFQIDDEDEPEFTGN